MINCPSGGVYAVHPNGSVVGVALPLKPGFVLATADDVKKSQAEAARIAKEDAARK